MSAGARTDARIAEGAGRVWLAGTAHAVSSRLATEVPATHRVLPVVLLALASYKPDTKPPETDATPTEDTPADIDADGDGLTADLDCDDDDAALGGDEVVYDGLDNDCDPSTPDDDLDRTVDCDDADLNNLVGVRAGDLLGANIPTFCDSYCARAVTISGNN